MSLVWYNPKCYRFGELNVGDRAITESYLWERGNKLRLEDGTYVVPEGVCYVEGTVTGIPNNRHCTVHVDRLHFKNGLSVKMRKDYEYNTSINFWFGETELEESEWYEQAYNDYLHDIKKEDVEYAH